MPGNTPLDSSTSPAKPAATGGSILVVDDDEASLQILKLTLESGGYSVATALNGLHALELLNAQPIELVLLDIMMPYMDGYEVLRRMKTDSGLRHIPVIVVSAINQTDSLVRCIELGAEDYLTKPYQPAILMTRITAGLEKKRRHDVEMEYLAHIQREQRRYDRLSRVVPIGVALQAEKNFDQMIDNILRQALSLSNADAGTLYLRTEDDRLKFVSLRNDSLGIAMGGATGNEIPFEPLALFDTGTGVPNHHNVATHAALTGESINIADAYQAEGFDFSGTRSLDEITGYTSTSFLTIPLKNNANHVIGVLQLINAQDPDTGQTIPFDLDVQQTVESLSSMAVVACEALLREERLTQQIERLGGQVDRDHRAA